MENKKSSKGLYVVIAILCVLILLLGGYIVYDKVLNDEKTPVNNTTNNVSSDNNETSDNDTNNETSEFSLELLKGVWGNCRLNELNNRVCYFKDIQEQDGAYVYRQGMYATGGSIDSKINKFDKLAENKYQLEIYSAGYDGPDHSYPEMTSTITVDISNIDNKIIYIDEVKYEYVTENMSNNSDLAQFFE